MGLINIYKYSHTMKPLLSNRFAVSFYSGESNTLYELTPMMKFNVKSVSLPNWAIDCSDTRMRFGSTQFAIPVFNFSSSTLSIEFIETEGMEVTSFLTNLFNGITGGDKYWTVVSPYTVKLKIDEFDYTYQTVLNSHIYVVKIKSIGQPEFSNTAKGEPITLTAEFNVVYQINNLIEPVTGTRKAIDVPVVVDQADLWARYDAEESGKATFMTEDQLKELYDQYIAENFGDDRRVKDKNPHSINATYAEALSVLLNTEYEKKGKNVDITEDFFLKLMDDLNTSDGAMINRETLRKEFGQEAGDALFDKMMQIRSLWHADTYGQPASNDGYYEWKERFLAESNVILVTELPSAPVGETTTGGYSQGTGLPPGSFTPATIAIDGVSTAAALEAINRIRGISNTTSVNNIKSEADIEKQLKKNWEKIKAKGQDGGASYEDYKAVTLTNLINTIASVETLNENLKDTGLHVEITGLWDAGHTANNTSGASHLWGAKADLAIYDQEGHRLKFGDVGTPTSKQSGYGAWQMSDEQMQNMQKASQNTGVVFNAEIRAGSAGWDDSALALRYGIHNGQIVQIKTNPWVQEGQVAEEVKNDDKITYAYLRFSGRGFTGIARGPRFGNSKARF